MITFDHPSIFRQLNDAADRCPDFDLSMKLSNMILEIGQARAAFIKEFSFEKMVDLNGAVSRAAHLLAAESATREQPRAVEV